MPNQLINKKTQQNIKGELSCVGVGMCLGSHLTPLSQSYIENADICFVAVSDALVEQWIFSFNDHCVSLQPLYEKGKSRNKTYAEMESMILESLYQGNRVCCVFYGHPGIFAKVPHRVIRQAKSLGIKAVMEAGISAEDTLYADLGIDPGEFGCQHYEASHLLIYKKLIDPTSYLILWQIGLVGDIDKSQFAADPVALKQLVNRLTQEFGPSHKVILYQAKTLAIDNFRAESISVAQLLNASLKTYTTLVIPPSQALKRL